MNDCLRRNVHSYGFEHSSANCFAACLFISLYSGFKLYLSNKEVFKCRHMQVPIARY